MTKGNLKSATPITIEDNTRRVEFARDCHGRQRNAAAEAAAHGYLLYRDTQVGESKQWLKREIDAFNQSVEDHNQELKNKFDRARKFVEKSLPENDHLNQPARDAEEQARFDAERVELIRLDALKPPERAHLKLVSAHPREGASSFMPLVRYLFGFDKDVHRSMVSRYCLVIEWIAAAFDKQNPVDLEMIKAAILAAEGFDHVVELQRMADEGDSDKQIDNQIIKEAIAAEARGIVLGLPSKALVNIFAEKPKDGFALVICRTNSQGLEILGEAEVSENEIMRAVTKFGDRSLVGADPSMEFLGRVLDFGKVIKDRQEIASGFDDGVKYTTDRIVAMRASSDGTPHLVVSVNRADSGPILHAKPRLDNILSLAKGACVLHGSTRKLIEREISDAGRRRFLSLQLETNPKTSEGKPAESPLSWELHNRALAEKQRPAAAKSFFWTALGKVTAKPLDVDNFSPQFVGTLDDVDLHMINDQLLKPWAANMAGNKAQRAFMLSLKNRELKVSCGDGDPLVLNFKTECEDTINMKFRIQDMYLLFQLLCDQHVTGYTLAGDEGGLLRLSWEDQNGFFDFYLPTLGSDGKLQSRRVAPMRSGPMLIAAE